MHINTLSSPPGDPIEVPPLPTYQRVKDSRLLGACFRVWTC